MVELQLRPPARPFVPPAAPPVEPSDAEIWWILLQSRLEDMRIKIPRTLVGTVQFEILASETRRFFFVELNGTKTRAGEGLLGSSDAWVTTREADLSMMNSSPLPGESPSFEVIGKLGLVERFFGALTGAKPSTAIALV